MAVSVGKGLPAPISMFNRICRSIFTRGESNLHRGWLRAKVLVGGEGLAGLAEAGAESGEHPSVPEGHRVQQRRASGRREVLTACSSGRRGGRSCLLGEGVWTEFIQEPVVSQAPGVMKGGGGGGPRKRLSGT